MQVTGKIVIAMVIVIVNASNWKKQEKWKQRRLRSVTNRKLYKNASFEKIRSVAQ